MSESRIVRAAAVQVSPDLERPGGTLEKVLAATDEAAGRGARFIVFPETFVPYYPYFSFIAPPAAQGPEHLRLYEGAVTVPGPVTQAVSAAARRHGAVIVLGINERDHGSLYNAQLIFDADGTLLLKRRKITPTYHERMIWGQGDGAGLTVVETAVGRVGALACWEHYNPLARYALMAQHEEIHAAQFPGSMVGSDLRRPDGGDDPAPRPGGRRLRRQRHRLAHRGADRQDLSRRADARGPARRQLYGHRLAGRQAPRPAYDGGRGHPRRRHGHGAGHQAQADDGFGRPLRPPRTPQPQP